MLIVLVLICRIDAIVNDLFRVVLNASCGVVGTVVVVVVGGGGAVAVAVAVDADETDDSVVVEMMRR